MRNLFLRVYQKTGTRDPSGTLKGLIKIKNWDQDHSGILAEPNKNQKSGTWNPSKSGKPGPGTLGNLKNGTQRDSQRALKARQMTRHSGAL